MIIVIIIIKYHEWYHQCIIISYGWKISNVTIIFTRKHFDVPKFKLYNDHLQLKTCLFSKSYNIIVIHNWYFYHYCHLYVIIIVKVFIFVLFCSICSFVSGFVLNAWKNFVHFYLSSLHMHLLWNWNWISV